MGVAERYKKYETVGSPYQDCGRDYIKIKYPCCDNPNCGKCQGEGFYLKVVRWHYDGIHFNGKNGFGFFEKEYITLFKGPQDIQDEYFSEKRVGWAWQNTIFGWFLPSNKEIPFDLPESLTPVKLTWKEITNEYGELYNYDSIREYVRNLLQGEKQEIKPQQGLFSVGNTIEGLLTVLQIDEEKDGYNTKLKILLEDDKENKFVWRTATKLPPEVGEKILYRFTISGYEQLENGHCILIKNCRRKKNENY